MIKSYFKVAWRNLFRNKGFSATNLLGLTIGMTCTILIFLWVQDEVTFDRFNTNYSTIYQVIANRDFKNQVFTDRNMVLPLAAALEEKNPQIRHAVVTTYQNQNVLAYGETRLKKTGYTVSEHFFDVFTWNFLQGNAQTALKDPESIVLTASAAKAMFGNADAMGKTVKMDNAANFKVTAIVADPPGNTTFRCDYIKPFNYNDADIKRSMNEWTNSSWNVFIQTTPGANVSSVEKFVNEVKHSRDPRDKISTYFMFPMSKWHLYSDFKDGKNAGGLIEYVKLFTIIAIIILLIACVNFMNLSTARSEKRAKEVGIRKTLGSVKRQLIFQFFTESIILASLAFIFSVLAVYLLLPSFNLLVNKNLSLHLTQPIFWLGALAIILITGLVAGSYPALYLSSFNPVKVLKGTLAVGKGASTPRHILVVAQFVISVLLISATVIVYQQIEYVRNRSVGYNPNNLIMIPLTDETYRQFDAVKDDLMRTGVVESATRSLSPITNIWWRSPAPDWPGKPADAQVIMSGQGVDKDFTKTMGIKMIEGSDFTGTPADSGYMLLNKAAVQAMNLKHPVGTPMRYGPRTYSVLGVTENIVMESPFKPVDPMMMFFQPGNTSMIHLRLKSSSPLQQSLATLESVFKKYSPAIPFEYQFVDQEFGKKFIAEELVQKITNIFAGLAIFICCIGLAGLASFTIEKRVKEIGIRKVLGASVGQVLALISKEFLRLVLIAFIIAVPLTWWLMNNWLSKYDFHISISIWLFAVVGALILLLTLVVVTLNTVRAASANPVKSLKEM